MKYRFIAFKAVLSVFIILAMLSIKPVPTNAGFVSGDEPVGGFSYMLDCAYRNIIPDGPYRNLYYQAYMRFHYDYNVSAEEREILCRIVEAEATGGNVEQKMNVASCVLARVESKKWPNTIKDVVFQYSNGVWQFSPLGDGRYYSVPITDSTRHAVDLVLKWGKITDCLWFCSDASYTSGHSWHKKHLEYGFFDEMHHYFY